MVKIVGFNSFQCGGNSTVFLLDMNLISDLIACHACRRPKKMDPSNIFFWFDFLFLSVKKKIEYDNIYIMYNKDY